MKLLQYYYKHSFFSVVLLLLVCSFTMKAEAGPGTIFLPGTLALSVNGSTSGGTYYNSSLGPSTFSYEASFNDLLNGTAGKNYIINGGIYTNCGANGNCSGNGRVWFQVIPNVVVMQSSADTVNVKLTGTVGNRTIDNTGKATNLRFKPTLNVPTLPWQADVQVFGNIDNKFLSTKTKPGTYNGVFTMQVTIP
jgi:hypothetical protein